MPDTPLNPEALAHAQSAAFDCLESGGNMDDLTACAIEAYLSVAHPEVNSFDPRVLNRRGWTCGCEPGNYDSCDECQSACDELADFLNRLEDTK